jgi:hypothetical protein
MIIFVCVLLCLLINNENKYDDLRMIFPPNSMASYAQNGAWKPIQMPNIAHRMKDSIFSVIFDTVAST